MYLSADTKARERNLHIHLRARNGDGHEGSGEERQLWEGGWAGKRAESSTAVTGCQQVTSKMDKSRNSSLQMLLGNMETEKAAGGCI